MTRRISRTQHKSPLRALARVVRRIGGRLELFEEIADRAGDVDSAGGSALAILDTLDDAGRLGALGAVGALGCVHYFLTVGSFSNLGHVFSENLFYTRTAGTVFGSIVLGPL